MVNEPIDESKLVTLGGNTTPAATRVQNDRGPVADDVRFDHLLLLLKRDPQTEADLKEPIEAMRQSCFARIPSLADSGANRDALRNPRAGYRSGAAMAQVARLHHQSGI